MNNPAAPRADKLKDTLERVRKTQCAILTDYVNDRIWQEGYAAGRQEADELARALDEMLKYCEGECGLEAEVNPTHMQARETLAAYRKGRTHG